MFACPDSEETPVRDAVSSPMPTPMLDYRRLCDEIVTQAALLAD